MNFTSQQEQAIGTTEGPVVIAAGPGSGKTAVIVERAARLVENKAVDPREILIISFTVNAANELRGRLSSRLESRKTPRVMTFHALAYEILGEESGNSSEASFLVATEQKRREIARRLSHTRGKHSHKLLLAVGRHKNGLVVPYEGIAHLTEKYNQALRAESLRDFDDLLIDARELLRTDREFGKGYQERYQYVMVDEYQDSNPLQARFLECLVGDHRNICVIGDPNQAIYSFRGATRSNFLEFSKLYPSCCRIELTDNHRSSPVIIQASDSLIGRREQRGSQGTMQLSQKHKNVVVVETKTSYQEMMYVTRTIQQLIGGIDRQDIDSGVVDHRERGAFDLSDIVVLYRTNAVGEKLEESLRYAGVPVERIGERSLFSYPDSKRVLQELEKKDVRRALSREIEAIVTSLSFSKQEPFEEQARVRRFEKLKRQAAGFDQMEPAEARRLFLESAVTAQPEDDLPSTDCVTLMTIHAAKGTEFPVVFVAGCEEGILPSDKDGSDVDEEKRLLYVAMTRAKERLYVSWAKRRNVYGKNEERERSRFLDLLPDRLLEHISVKKELSDRRKKEKMQKKLF